MLKAHWKFNEISGNADDSSGFNNTGTIINAPTYVPGKFGNAISLSYSV